MKVSVVIPSYNHEKFIAEAIQSVLDQTFQDFEIIITDDGSVDSTIKEIEKFDDPRIKLFKLDRNQGFYFAFKKCLEESCGDYIAMLSSDDIFLSDKLEKQVKFLDENKNYAAVFSFAQIIDGEGNDFKDENHFYSKIFIQENRSRYAWLRTFFYDGNCLCHPSVLIRKEYYTIDQFDSRYRQLPDFDFWIKLCMKAEIYVLQEKLIKFRLLDSEKNTSGNTPNNTIRDRYEFSKILNSFTKLTLTEYKNVFDNKVNNNFDDKDIEYLIAREALKVDSLPHKQFSINKLYDLLQSSVMVDNLKKKFNFTLNDYFHLIPNVLCHVNKENYIQLYVDEGNGFSELKSIKQSLENREFILNEYPNNCSALRFDPLNDYLILKINSIYADNKELTIKSSNAFYIEKNIYYFDTPDPQIYLKLKNKKMSKVFFEIEFIAIGDFARNQFSNIYKKILEKKSQQIENLNNKLNNISLEKEILNIKRL